MGIFLRGSVLSSLLLLGLDGCVGGGPATAKDVRLEGPHSDDLGTSDTGVRDTTTPDGHDAQEPYDPIPDYLGSVDVARLSEVASVLVSNFGPRHQDFYQVYVDNQCTLAQQVFSMNNLDRAADYVMSLFANLGYMVEAEPVTLQDSTPGFNVVATKNGEVTPGTFIEVGAHVDSVKSAPGAGDNASGVTAILEIARILKGYRNKNSLRFIAFVGEEYGLTGSKQHLAGVVARGEPIRAALILDGIGWSESASSQTNCTWDNGEAESLHIASLYDHVRTYYGLDVSWRSCSPTGNTVGDNISYWQQGFPAVMSVGGLPYQAPGYHQCGDTLAAFNLENVHQATLLNLAVLLKLDGEPFPVRVWEQTDWSGGPGQKEWTDQTKYLSAVAVEVTIPGELRLAAKSGGEVLLADEFSGRDDPSDPLKRWTVHAGTWSAAQGELTSASPPLGYSFIYHDAAWVDYSVTGRFRLPLGGYAACVIGRLDAETGAQYCACAYQGGTLKLIKLENWTTWSWKELQSAQIPYIGSAWHTLKLDFSGDRLRVSYDGVSYLDMHDASLAAGGVGLLTFTPSGYSESFGAKFDDVAVQNPGEFVPEGTLLSSAVDGGAGVTWSRVTFDSLMENGTAVTFRTRTADQRDLLSAAPWSSFFPGNSSVERPNHRWIQLEFKLASSAPSRTPVLYEAALWRK